MNKYKKMAREENVLVIWNINNCPIPDGHDPLLVVPRIQTALEKSRRDCPYGHLTITAISNNLTEIPGEDVLRKLSSAGISIKHDHGVQTDLSHWAIRNPPPATIMVITGHEELEHLASTFSELEEEGYRIIRIYPQPNPAPPSLPKLSFWETLLSDADNKLVTTSRLLFHGKRGYPWSCLVCFFDTPMLDDFTKHLKSETHAYHEWDRVARENKVDLTNPANMQIGRSQEWDLLAKADIMRRSEVLKLRGAYAPPRCKPVDVNSYNERFDVREEKAWVIWNISKCPIPDGHDPLLVVPRIQTALEKSRCNRPYGPLSITAFSNNLTEIPGEDVMRKLSSAGVSLKHAHGVQTDLYQWAKRNPPPATIMVISGHKELELLASTFSGLEEEGYRILLTYPQPNQAPPSLPKLCFWETLLSDANNKLETTSRLVFHGTGESPWSCSICHYDAPTFEDFTTHLKCEAHAYFEWDRYASKNNIDRTNPANMQFGRSPEWDLLAKEDMLRRTAAPKMHGGFASKRSKLIWVDAKTFKRAPLSI